MTTQMRLSEAMVCGVVLLRPIAAGRSAHPNRPGAGCALDMAMEAVGSTSKTWVDAPKHWPWLLQHTDGSHNPGFISNKSWANKIVYRFDVEVMIFKSMTFDAFVDWVRTVEEPFVQAETNVSSPVERVEVPA